MVPVEFIVAAEARKGTDAGHHRLLVASCLAQGQALAFGRTPEEARREMAAAGVAGLDAERLVPHRTFPGDRPTTTIVHRRLDARALGRLVALYEHRVFVEAVVWGVNPFDQWGVELGKTLADRLRPALDGGPLPAGTDSSTAGLLARLRQHPSERKTGSANGKRGQSEFSGQEQSEEVLGPNPKTHSDPIFHLRREASRRPRGLTAKTGLSGR